MVVDAAQRTATLVLPPPRSAGLRASECGNAADQPNSGLGGLGRALRWRGYKIPQMIGWNNATSNITSVTDTAGNIYQLAVPTVRGTVSARPSITPRTSSWPPPDQYRDGYLPRTTQYVSALWSTAASIWPIRSMSALRVRHQQFGEQRRGYDHCRSRTHHRSRNDDWWLLGSRQRLHHSRYHFAQRRHCRRPVRDRYRELQRHRIALGVRGMGDAGRDLQDGISLASERRVDCQRAWKQTRQETTLDLINCLQAPIRTAPDTRRPYRVIRRTAAVEFREGSPKQQDG
jgi:hypothetical protein